MDVRKFREEQDTFPQISVTPRGLIALLNAIKTSTHILTISDKDKAAVEELARINKTQ